MSLSIGLRSDWKYARFTILVMPGLMKILITSIVERSSGHFIYASTVSETSSWWSTWNHPKGRLTLCSAGCVVHIHLFWSREPWSPWEDLPRSSTVEEPPFGFFGESPVTSGHTAIEPWRVTWDGSWGPGDKARILHKSGFAGLHPVTYTLKQEIVEGVGVTSTDSGEYVANGWFS